MPELNALQRHYARRFTGGITPALAADIAAEASPRAWFEKQMDPKVVPDPVGAPIWRWFPSLSHTAGEIFQRQRNGTQGAWEVMYDLSRMTVARRIHSSRQFKELMVDFWSNLLHVPLMDDNAMFHRVAYDQMIRTYAMTTFEALLLHSTTHPCMGLYLDNAISTKDSPNENLGRELLELHTVGVNAGYTEKDVKASARILTGWRSDVWWPSFRTFYDPKVHATGRVSVLGFSRANTAADGQALTREYLSYLARHPATANRIARRLCVRFVSDTPSAGLVSAVAAAYTRSGTAVKPTLRAMVDHPEFARSAGAKVRTPIEDYIASVRAVGTTLQRPTANESFASTMYWQYREYGQAPYEWPAPNGFPDANAAWSSAGRILTSFSMHRAMAAHWWPSKGADFVAASSMLPAVGSTVQEAIDTVSLRVLGQRPGATVSQGIATLLGWSLTKKLTQSDVDRYWPAISIVASLLDSPLHLHR